LKKVRSGIDFLKPYFQSRETARGFLALMVLVILDAGVSAIASIFLGQPVLLTLSNILFLEGALAFTIGSFIAFATTSPRRKPKKKKGESEDGVQVSKERLEEYVTGKPEPIRMPLGPLLILLGVILIVLSVVTLEVLILI
jgi:hypothetical protein